MKRLFTLFVAMLMVLTVFAAPAAAADEISVYLNGQKMEFDVPPVLLNDRTMVPMRAIFEALGASVSWDDYTDTATGLKDGKSVSVTIDRPEAYVGTEKVMLDQSPVILNDRTLVPLRFVSESYGAEVNWDDKTQTVSITADTNEHSVIYFQVPDCDELATWTTDNCDPENPAIMGTKESENAGKEVSLDVTNAIKTILASGDYGSILTVRLNGANWGGKMGNVSPIYFDFKFADVTPDFIADNGDKLTITVNPAHYSDGAVSVITAMYTEGGRLDKMTVNTLPGRDKYSVFEAEKNTEYLQDFCS